MSDQEIIRVLTEIKEKLTEIHNDLNDIREDLRTDRANLWKILALTIIGSFALIGVKLVFP